MMHFFILFALLAPVSCVLFYLITPDDVRHANQYCSKNNGLSYQLVVGNNLTDNEKYHCFMKCFLRRTGLVNLTSLGIDEEKFNRQNFKSKGKYIHFEKLLNGSCKPYYEEWSKALNEEDTSWMRSGFYFERNFEIDFDKTFPNISKPKGTSAQEICLLRHKIENLDLVMCLFSYLRFFDAYGRLDFNEINVAFRSCPVTSNQIKKCVHHGNTFYKRGAVKMASELQSCLKGNCPSYETALMNSIKRSKKL